MSELLPSIQAADVRAGLVDYLTTTFALADSETREALDRFLSDPGNGVFKGPFVRLRLPFKPAEPGAERVLEWFDGFPPYGHQAAAFARLSSANLGSDKPRPLPTLVTTGTGSGKTEAFLYPILDHVLRAKREGITGTKALILYPMNALANDQARRLTELITTKAALGGVRAALYTGQESPTRSKVTAEGLITNREAMRDDAPDILLTNYKMLDQLLLRPADQTLWKQSATSLRYLVLDEFHTYDGAQGTDVAMLLRRLGLALKRNWPAESALIDDAARERPLGLITPVATSATLGDKGDPAVMTGFAHTVFGDDFGADSVVTETRLDLDEWVLGADEAIANAGLIARPVDDSLLAEMLGRLPGDDVDDLAGAVVTAVFGTLYASAESDESTAIIERAAEPLLLAASRAHPFLQNLYQAAHDPISIADLAGRLLGAGLGAQQTAAQRDADRVRALEHIIAALGAVRARHGREAASVDLNLWVRALSRLDRTVESTPRFHWSDDGPDLGDALNGEGIAPALFPALYCRHCGRSGWGVQLASVGESLDANDVDIRRNHAKREGRFRALIHAPLEGERHRAALEARQPGVDGVMWFDPVQRGLLTALPAESDALPVLALSDKDADDDSRKDVCPNCRQTDGIRFLGSAIATLLSVSITTIFGDRHLDASEKKALVFTDSVQDAAHRAGFVQSRSHVFSLRNAMRDAVGNETVSLDDLVERMISNAKDPFERHRMLAPDIVDRELFAPYWNTPPGKAAPTKTLTAVRRRLRFDVALEFGLQSRVGRTLERTGSLAVCVDAGPATRLETLGRSVLKDYESGAMLEGALAADSASVVRWVRGVLERMRERGAIEHEWLRKYVQGDGQRWAVWGGRPRGQGMPAFPAGREAPAFPRVGKGLGGAGYKASNLDHASSAQSWYARWASRTIGVTPGEGATLTRMLFTALENADLVVGETIGDSSSTAYQLRASSVLVAPISEAERLAGGTLLVCDTCRNPVPGAVAVVDQLAGGPCTAIRCDGTLEREPLGPVDFYRSLYDDGSVRRVLAREHTGLLPDETRLAYENGFKSSDQQPDAPNVLVATPTLEMGIDIGDLSAVVLSGLPRTVASYLQRVGRAGRLTGNALALAFVEGRGDQLPKLGDPLSVINGEVRPPATYLDATEILQRQYIASIIDKLASLGKLGSVRVARDVLASTDGDSLLAMVIDEAETRADELLDRFIGTFGGQLRDWAVDALHQWARRPEGSTDVDRTSPLAHTIIGASQRWTQEREVLGLRRKAISDTLPELEAAANHPAATEDDKTDLRAAKASLAMVMRQIQNINEEYWVGALERYGVLPNYSLLDDSVTLDVAISWIDPETGDFEHASAEYSRHASIAISELAPGAHFYAQGIEIEIDAVDLGPEGSNVQKWVFCPSCGFARDTAIPVDAATAAACPRCGNTAIVDAAQTMDVVELEHVTAEVRRDEAVINDRSDERERERFTVQIAADIDPQQVESQWYVEGSSFGVKLLRSMTIRWVNLGRQLGSGPSRFLSGHEHQSPLFRVCAACGKLDQQGSVNSRREHRAWCRYRSSSEEHVRTVALTRTLTTQGLVMRLPTSVTVGDSIALPSLSAAVQLGLREIIGGDPDHLQLVTIVEPVNTGGDENATALLVHDTVPGGTGYLADLAAHERIREVLEAAWRVVANCECRNEARAACHRCLLPFAPGLNVDSVSRASAERNLRRILGVDENDQPTPWSITTVDPGVDDPESHLEQWFRKVFIERAKTLGGAIREVPGPWGNRVEVKAGGRIWMLTPQVFVAGSRPDFVLAPIGGGARPIAIFLDGYKYHASVQHNRIADDALKRTALRLHNHHVLALTWDDIKRVDEGAAEPTPWWYDEASVILAGQAFGLSPATLQTVAQNPMTHLMEWMLDPDAAQRRWASVAQSLPVLTAAPFGTFASSVGTVEALMQRAIDVVEGKNLGAGSSDDTWHVTRDGVVMATRYDADRNSSSVVLLLDDRAETVAREGFANGWRTWLRLANLLGPAVTDGQVDIVAHSIAEQVTAERVRSGDELADIALPATWREALQYATADERELLTELAGLGGVPMPELGVDLADGIPVSMVWREARVAVAYDLSESDRAALTADGWTVAEPEAEALASKLRGGSS